MIQGTQGNVYSIQEINNKLLIGHHNGAFEIENDKPIEIYNKEGTWRYIKAPNNNDIIAGTYRGFIKLNKDAEFLKEYRGFEESSRVFEFEDSNNLWMTHGYKGAYKIKFDDNYNKIDKIDFYGDQKGFPSNLLINVFPLDRKLYFPAEYGIYTYNKKQDLFINQLELESIIGDYLHVSNFTMDSDQNIYYIIENKAIGILKYQSFNKYEKITNQFSKINKYISDDLENITIIDDNNILFGAKDGFVHYDPSVEITKNSKFEVFIRSIKAITDTDSTLYDGGYFNNEYNFPSVINSFRFNFSSPFFDGYEDNLYQYKLEKFEENWSEWSKTSMKEYTNLSPGKYTFKVRAKNIYDNISSEATFEFEIYPHWYLSRAVITLYFLVFCGLLLLSFYLFRLKYKTQQKRLEIDKTREIQKKNRELIDVSKRSDEAITNLRNEKLRVEVEFKNRELASSTMHILNKNEIMLGIKHNLHKYLKESKDQSGKREINRIIKAIDTNIADDENWDQFTKHFDQVHGSFLRKLKDKYPDLTPQEVKLAAYLRMNLTTKNIAQLFNISVRCVEISRYRLRKKLKLDRDVNLASFIMDI